MNMNFASRHSTTLVWLVLACATVVSWWFGTGHSALTQGHTARTGTLIMALAFVKAHLILYHFMGVRHAPLVLNILSSLWVLCAGPSIIGLYLFKSAS